MRPSSVEVNPGSGSVEVAQQSPQRLIQVSPQGSVELILKAQNQFSEMQAVIPAVQISELPASNVSIGKSALNGWRFYQDSTYTAANPLFIPAGQRTVIPDNNKGMLSVAYGADSTNWYNTSTSKFYPDNTGDFFFYRLNVTIQPVVNNKSVTVDFDIGTANKVYTDTSVLNQGAGVARAKSWLITASAGPSYKSNGGTINFTPEADCYIYGVTILALKSFGMAQT